MSHKQTIITDDFCKAYINENSKFHREDGPAIEDKNGDREWLVNGKYHRIDGPAIEKANGVKQYFLGGIYYSEDDYNRTVKEYLTLSKILKVIDPRDWVRRMK